MKTGKTLSQLAAEIERQQSTKRDLITSTTNMEMAARTGGGVLIEVGGKQTNQFDVNSLGHDQIGVHTKIPSQYYDRMLTEEPALLATNVNKWFAKYPAPRLIRTLGR